MLMKLPPRGNIPSWNQTVLLPFCSAHQKLPVLEASSSGALDGVSKGAYILADADDKPDVILIGSGL
jgi:transketolase